MNDVIVIDNLSKSYKQLKAVDDLSFRVKRGELFAFLGINGAGKSTTINIICGQLKKDQGKVYIADMDIEKNLQLIKHKIGVVFQNSILDPQLSVKDNLQVKASLYSMKKDEIKKRVEYLADLLDFKSYINRPIGKLSGGQKRRIDIARALLHQPEILILDEPTTGLHFEDVKLLLEVLLKLRDQGNTVVVIEHNLDVIKTADYLIDLGPEGGSGGGQVVACGTPEEICKCEKSFTGQFLKPILERGY